MMIAHHFNGSFGKMVAFEGVAAFTLFAFGKLAPALKARATAAITTTIAEASPELAEQIGGSDEQADQPSDALSTSNG